MNISFVTVGKLKEKYLKQGLDEYIKRLSGYTKIEIIEVPDEKAPEQLSAAEMEEVKNKEGQRILSKISSDTYVIALVIEAKQLSSEEFARTLEKLAVYGKSKVAFVIAVLSVLVMRF